MGTHNRGVTPRAIPQYAHIIGWGMAVPEKILSNEDLAAIDALLGIDLSDNG